MPEPTTTSTLPVTTTATSSTTPTVTVTPGTATATAPPAPPAPPNPPAPPSDEGEPFDEERAMATIRNLREVEKQAKKDAKRLADLEAKLKGIEDADKTELEKAQAKVAELEQASQTAASERRDLVLRAAVNERAVALGIASPRLALAALDRDAVTFDDAGQPTNLDEALTALLEREPVLKGAPQPPTSVSLNAGSGSGGQRPPDLTAEELQAASALGMTPERYAAYRNVATVSDYQKQREREKQSAA